MISFSQGPSLDTIITMPGINYEVKVVCKTTSDNDWITVSETAVELDLMLDKLDEVKLEVVGLEIRLQHSPGCPPWCAYCWADDARCVAIKPSDGQIKRLVDVVKGCNKLESLTLVLMHPIDVHNFFLADEKLPTNIKSLTVSKIGDDD